MHGLRQLLAGCNDITVYYGFVLDALYTVKVLDRCVVFRCCIRGSVS